MYFNLGSEHMSDYLYERYPDPSGHGHPWPGPGGFWSGGFYIFQGRSWCFLPGFGWVFV